MTKEESDKAGVTASKIAGPVGMALFLGVILYVLFSKKPKSSN